jgi:hypothetical protein
MGDFYQGKQIKIDGKYVWTSKHQAADILWSKIGKRICGRTDVQRDQKEEVFIGVSLRTTHHQQLFILMKKLQKLIMRG